MASADLESRDSFTKREKAQEDFYVKEKEKEKSVVPRPALELCPGVEFPALALQGTRG